MKIIKRNERVELKALTTRTTVLYDNKCLASSSMDCFVA